MSALNYYSEHDSGISLHVEPRPENRDPRAAVAISLHLAWHAYDRLLDGAYSEAVQSCTDRRVELLNAGSRGDSARK